MEQGCEWPGNEPLMRQYHDEEWGMLCTTNINFLNSGERIDYISLCAR